MPLGYAYGTLHLGHHQPRANWAQVRVIPDHAEWKELDKRAYKDWVANQSVQVDSRAGAVLLDQVELTLVRIIATACAEHILYSEYFPLNDGSVIIRLYFIPTFPNSSNGNTPGHRTFDGLSQQKFSIELGCLLNHVSTSRMHWSGCPGDDTSCGNYKFRLNPVDNTLAGLFNRLPSPPSMRGERLPPPVAALVHQVFHAERLPGMKSALHQYQRASVAKMLHKETHPGSMIDPLFVPLKNLLTGDTFYFQPTILTITPTPPHMAQPYGGILGEELGAGKTCMLLGLILLTLHQLPSPEDSLLEPRPVLTPVSLRHFKSSDSFEARESIYAHGEAIAHLTSFPTLAGFIAHRLRADPDARRFREIEEAGSMYDFLRELRRNAPFYLQSSQEDPVPRRGSLSRYPTLTPPRRIFLSAATLIIVPPHLFIQWQSEIHKHCEDALRVLAVASEGSVPDAEQLANDFDVILLSTTQFSREAKRGKGHGLDFYTRCFCPSSGITGIPDCSCESASAHSPLKSIRWKRLIIDEGHVLSNHTTELSTLTSRVSAERRWLVSGTPTTHLIGTGLGSQQKSDVSGDDSSQLVVFRKSNAKSSWNPDDRKDLLKLSSIFTHFLQLPQFAVDHKLFTNLVVNPLMITNTAPPFGSVQIIYQLLAQNIVRHRVQDIEKEIALPCLHKEVVVLEMDPFGKKTYNVIQAAIAVNAVDSERTDQDYLFHPSNVKSLFSVIAALSQATFWHADPRLFKINEVLHNAESSLGRVKDRQVSPEDCLLLQNSIRHLKNAANDARWRGMLAREEVCYRTFCQDKDILNAWSRLPVKDHPPPLLDCEHSQQIDCHYTGLAYLQADRITQLRNVFAIPESSREGLIVRGNAAQAEDAEIERRREVIHQQKSPKKRKNTDEFLTSSEPGSGKVAELAHKSREQVNYLSNGVSNNDVRIPFVHQDVVMPTIRDFPRVEIRGSVSAKLNWILREVTGHSTEEKFLVFSASPLTLAHIGDGLDLLRVPYLTFASTTDHKIREQMPVTFQTAANCRVMLMELKYGARGLNLTAASRVIFCEPIWHADIESQAIKRAHRIGQLKPIIVKTLAIRSTFEEVVLSRRNFSEKTTSRGPAITEEPGMRAFLKDPHFLEYDDKIDEWATDEQPLLGFPSHTAFI